MNVEASRADETSLAAPAADPRVVNARYVVLRELGRGGMGTVYLVADRRREGEEIALKSVRRDRVDDRTLGILQNEFLTLARLKHPNILEAREFGTDNESDDLFFTSECFPGKSWVEVCGRLDREDELLAFLEVLVQVLRALEFVHVHGIVHADLKPDNVLVRRIANRTGAIWHAKLIDFGLAKEANTPGGEKILGTPYYVAPETILGSEVDARTDLYSLGVMLYRLATGRLPFQGARNLDVLRGHVEKEAEPPHKVVPGLPNELSDFIVRLMAKDPDERFGSALEIIDHVRRAFGVALPFETHAGGECYIEAALLAGRELELRQVGAVYTARVGDGRWGVGGGLDWEFSSFAERWKKSFESEEQVDSATSLLLISGEAGLEHWRLVGELRKLANVEGGDFLEVACSGEDGGERELLAQLVVLSRAAGGSAPARLASALEHLALEFGSGRTRIHENDVSALVDGVGELVGHRAFVIHFHDIQSASAVLVSFVRKMMARIGEHEDGIPRVLLSATQVSDSARRTGPFAAALRDQLFASSVFEVRLQRLGREGIHALLEQAFPAMSIPESLLRLVYEESDGNTATAVEILLYLVRHDRITRSRDGWVLDQGFEVEEVPGRVRSRMREEILAWPADVRQLATICAAIGMRGTLSIAASLADISQRRASTLLRVMTRSGIMIDDGEEDADRFAFAFPSARALLYDMIDEEDRALLHGEIASLLRSAGATVAASSDELARHYLAAGDAESSVRFGCEAARGLAERLALAEAVDLYERVLAVTGMDDAALVSRVGGEIASLYFQMADFRRAAELFGAIREELTEDKGKVPVSLTIDAARACSRLGDFATAERLLAEAATEDVEGAEGAAPAQAKRLLAAAELGFLAGDVVRTLRCCQEIERDLGRTNDPVFLGQLRMLQAESHAFLNDRSGAASYCQRAIRTLDAQRDERFLGWSFFCRGKLQRYKGKYHEALQQFKMSLALCRKQNSVVSEADCLLELGDLQLVLSAPQEALSSLERALVLFEQNGDRRGAVTALSALAETYRVLGKYAQSHEALKRVLGRIGRFEHQATTRTLLTFARYFLDRGDLERAARYVQNARARESAGSGTAAETVHALTLQSEICYQQGNIEEALDFAAKGVLAAREDGDPLRLATALTQHAHILSGIGKTGEARRIVVALFDLAKRHGLRITEGWAYLLEGSVLADHGRYASAEKSLARAVATFKKSGSKRELLALFLERSRVALATKDYEQAFLDLKEGLFVAKKLDMPYVVSRYCLGVGLLESALGSERRKQAEANLLVAGKLAREKRFRELFWRVLLELARLYLRDGREEEASEMSVSAYELLQDLLERIPVAYRAAYLERTSAGDLLEISRATMEH